MAKPITNIVKIGQTPVIKKDLEGGVLGEANNDGTIFIDKSVKEGTPMYYEVVGHELEHHEQMKKKPKTGKPDLAYDDNSVTWKGKKYLRKNGKIIDPKTGKGHPEGSMKFDWEKEAHKAGKQARKQAEKQIKKNKKNKDDMNYDNNSMLNMNMASPITKKAKGYGSPLPSNGDKPKLVVDAKDNVVKELDKLKSKQIDPDAFKVVVDANNPIDQPTVLAEDGDKLRETLQKEIESGFAGKKYGYLGNKIGEYLDAKKRKKYAKRQRVYGTKEVEKDKLTPVTTTDPGKPREQGDYHMDYYESRNKAAAARVQEREGRRNIRQSERALKKYYRLEDQGKKPINPKTMKPFETAEEYAKYKVRQVDFTNPVSKREEGDKGDTQQDKYVTGDTPGYEGLPVYDKGKLFKPVTTGGMVTDFLSKNKENSLFPKVEFKMSPEMQARLGVFNTTYGKKYGSNNSSGINFKLPGYGKKKQ